MASLQETDIKLELNCLSAINLTRRVLEDRFPDGHPLIEELRQLIVGESWEAPKPVHLTGDEAVVSILALHDRVATPPETEAGYWEQKQAAVILGLSCEVTKIDMLEPDYGAPQRIAPPLLGVDTDTLAVPKVDLREYALAG